MNGCAGRFAPEGAAKQDGAVQFYTVQGGPQAAPAGENGTDAGLLRKPICCAELPG